jgi:hypothetical protein
MPSLLFVLFSLDIRLLFAYNSSVGKTERRRIYDTRSIDPQTKMRA